MNPILSASQPIGIFDSGIGGLTVAHAIVQHLPKENIIYFGDTAHLPYGDKSATTIQTYALNIANLLLQKKCKLILIACNSASAAAYETVKEQVGNKAIVINVIDPTIQLLKLHYGNQDKGHKRIGLIGTRQTVLSQIYKKKVDQLNLNIHLSSYATNLLAAAIEEFGNHHVIDILLDTYLAYPELQQIDALVLACTHYPVIKERIATYYKNNIHIIDSSDTVAAAVKVALEKHQLLNTNGISTKYFYVSDYTESFVNSAKLFFGEEIKLTHHPVEELIDIA